MKIYDRLKNGFIDKSYYISFSEKCIYIMNYKKIILFDNDVIKLDFNNFQLLIKGFDFKIKRKTKYELEITGNLSKVEILNEV